MRNDGFAGDILLKLATEGRWVLDAETADSLVEGLEEALDMARLRVFGMHMRSCATWGAVIRRFPDLERISVDAAFAEQVAPGRAEQALRELPKYIEAVHRAKASRPAH